MGQEIILHIHGSYSKQEAIKIAEKIGNVRIVDFNEKFWNGCWEITVLDMRK